MAKFGQSSKYRLAAVDERLQRIFNIVIEHFDCSVICGVRTAEEQNALYAIGRTKPGKIVTNCDGYKTKSAHQSGMAVDVVPYPIVWEDIERFKQLAWLVKGVGLGMGINVDCGAFWKFTDYPHYEIKA